MGKDHNQENRELFESEIEILKEANKVIAQDIYQSNELLPTYHELLRNYEKLLKLTKKVFKISDIQGKILKDQEMEIKAMNENLLKAECARKRLISDISHELGTPMTSIHGYIKAMMDRIVPPDDRYFSIIYEKTILVNRLIQDLFELSKLEANQSTLSFQYMPAREMIENLLLKYKLDVINAGLQFEINISEDWTSLSNIMIYIDPVRIDQVLANLISNAIKFTSKGEVTINCKVEWNASWINDQKSEHFLISVRDTGVGIDEGSLSVVFDRFYREEKSKKLPGTGLGLSIAREIVQKHGGEIGVESIINVGSTFFFTLPIEMGPSLSHPAKFEEGYS